jgi:hypothetical protein
MVAAIMMRRRQILLLAHIKPKENSVSLISIPRVLWVNLPIYQDKDFIQDQCRLCHGSDYRNMPTKLRITANPCGEFAKNDRHVVDSYRFSCLFRFSGLPKPLICWVG